MLFRAIKFVADAHEGQYRKGTKIPYISHLMNVMKILSENDCDTEIVVTGILHDTIEDTPTSLETIACKFGNRVATIVAGASEPGKTKNDNQEKANWKSRKEHTIENLQIETNLDILLASCADKLDNVRAIYQDYLEIGDSIWSRFNAGKDEQKWYYQSLSKIFLQRGEEFGNPLLKIAKEFDKTVSQIFPSKL